MRSTAVKCWMSSHCSSHNCFILRYGTTNLSDASKHRLSSTITDRPHVAVPWTENMLLVATNNSLQHRSAMALALCYPVFPVAAPCNATRGVVRRIAIRHLSSSCTSTIIRQLKVVPFCFCRKTLYIAWYAVVRCLSFTFMHCSIEKSKHILKLCSPAGSATILVSAHEIL